MSKSEKLISQYIKDTYHNSDEYKKYKEKYDSIRSKYGDILSNKSKEEKIEFVRIEKCRIQNKKLECDSGIIGSIDMYAILLITIVITTIDSCNCKDIIKYIALIFYVILIVIVIIKWRMRDILKTNVYNLICTVLDDIDNELNKDKVDDTLDKNIPSKKIDTCVNKKSELFQNQSYNSEGKKHFTNRIKFEKYCSLFSEYFNKEIDYKENNMDLLIEKIYDIYDSIADDREKAKEEIKLKDKLSEYTLDINNGINTTITAVLTLLSSFAIQVLVVMLNNKNIIYYEVFKGLVYTFLGFAIYCLFFYAKDILTHKAYKGFYTLCLNTLKSVNEDKKHQNK